MRLRLLVLLVLLSAAVASIAPVDSPPVAAAPEAGSSDWRMISAGPQHTCGIRTSGRLYCWGWDGAGQLGDGGTNTNRTTPTEVAGGATDWTTVGTGEVFTCGRRATGRLYCWGDDTSGYLGDGAATTGSTTPTQVAGGRTDWAALSVGWHHACARRTSGRLFCWGSNGDGQLGKGDKGSATSSTVPVQVAGNARNWSGVSAGRWSTCARRTTGRLFCWGSDASGLLGNGPASDSTVPTQVAGRRTDWAAVSVGAAHACARRTSGRLFCWGYDLDGELGNGGPNVDRIVPVQVAGGRTDWTAVTAGSFHTCARRTSGRLFCWGYNGDGQGGDGSPDPGIGVPREVAGRATDWTRKLDAGERHTCAIITSGRAFCWGEDLNGQLGDNGTDTGMPHPVQVFA